MLLRLEIFKKVLHIEFASMIEAEDEPADPVPDNHPTPDRIFTMESDPDPVAARLLGFEDSVGFRSAKAPHL